MTGANTQQHACCHQLNGPKRLPQRQCDSSSSSQQHQQPQHQQPQHQQPQHQQQQGQQQRSLPLLSCCSQTHGRAAGPRSRCSSSASSRQLLLLAAAALVSLLALSPLQPAAAAREPPLSPVPRAHSWSHFNIEYYSFPGRWNGHLFQCHVWLRLVCRNSTTNTARLVVALHDAPAIRVSPGGVHAVTPPELLGNSSSSRLPKLWFEGVDTRVSIDVTQFVFDELVRNATDAAAVTATAELPAGAALTLRMEGSERVHEVQQGCSPPQHPLFANHSVWLGIVDATSVQDLSKHAKHTRSSSSAGAGGSSAGGSSSSEAGGAAATEAASGGGTAASSIGGGTFGSAVSGMARRLLGRLSNSLGGGSTAAASSRISSYLANDNLEDLVLDDNDMEHPVRFVGRTSRRSSDDSSGIDTSNTYSSYGHDGRLGERQPSARLPGAGQDDGIAEGAADPALGAAGGSTAAVDAAQPSLQQQSSRVGGGLQQGVGSLAAETPAAAGGDSFVAAAGMPARAPTPAPAPSLSGPDTIIMAGDYSAETHAPVEVPVPAAPTASEQGGSGVVDDSAHGDILRFLTLQHLQHHKSLGFSGSIMVVMKHTADILLQSAALRRAVARKRLVLVLWDLGLEPRASHFMQVPAYNLLRLAAWGSNSSLGFWDLDEYMVLPQHRPISEEIYSRFGCMKEFLDESPEAIIPSMWVRSNTWAGSPELVGWLQHGRWSGAVQGMDYAMWPYTFCDGACKAMINPTSDALFQVHQHMFPPPRVPVFPVSWRCGYILHFYRLWTLRTPALMTGMGYINVPKKIPGVPLLMEDILPHSMLQRLAKMARLYSALLQFNPSLANATARGIVGGGFRTKAQMASLSSQVRAEG